MAPNIAIPTSRLTAAETTKVRIRNRRRGIAGSGCAALDDDERRPEHDCCEAEPDDDRRAPRVLGAAPRREQDEADDGRAQQGRCRPSRCARTGRRTDGRQDRAGHEQGEDAERHVDVEDPAPGQVVGEEAAQQRAGDAGGPEDGAEEPLVAAALTGADDVGDDRHGQDDEPTGADALDGPEGDERAHRRGHARQDAAGQEDHDGRLEEALAAVEVAELAEQRRRHGLGQQVGGHDPGDVVRGRRGRRRWSAGRSPRWSGRSRPGTGRASGRRTRRAPVGATGPAGGADVSTGHTPSLWGWMQSSLSQ